MSTNIGLMGNIIIKGTLTAKTGLHIGASADTVEIGGIDSPVIKHPVTGEPYIPGSSLKGKMRSFAEKIEAAVDKDFEFNRYLDSAKKIRQHVCSDIDFSYNASDNKGAKKCPVCRVYGSTGYNGKRNHPARIIVRDCMLTDDGDKAIRPENLYIFEAKMENAIDRITAAAQPRTFERVPSGAEFRFEIIYKVQGDIENNNGKTQLLSSEINNIQKDIRNIFEILSLIEKDGLGGSISRGYGQVEFSLDNYECKYFKVGGTDEDFLPVNGDQDAITNLDQLRQNDFSHLTLL